jgi:dTMP kinase
MRHETVETGKLITFEGGEGAGKSTQASILASRLKSAGREVIATREPGGSAFAEEIRETLLSGKARQFGPLAEAVLFSVARQDHVDNVIAGALAHGTWVVCDRFLDSTRAYQGAGGGVAPALIGALERVTLKGLKPHLTFVLDLPANEGLSRARARLKAGAPDRFEGQEIAEHDRIRRAFLDIAEQDPRRCVVIDASKPEALVAEDVWEAVVERLHP